MSLPLNVIIASAVRTPVGRGIKGSLKDTRPDDLAAWAMVAAVGKVPGLAPEAIGDIVLGCAMPEGEQGLNLARNAVQPLARPVGARGNDVVLPAQFFSDWLPAAYAARVSFSNGVLRVSGPVVFVPPKPERLQRIVVIDPGHGGEDTGKIGGVGKPGQGLAIDYQVITEIRTFEISTEGADTANVEIFAKILNDRNGTVLAQKAFRATAAVRGTGNTAFIKAMDTMTVPTDIFGSPEMKFGPKKRLGNELSRMSQIQDGRWKVVSDYVK